MVTLMTPLNNYKKYIQKSKNFDFLDSYALIQVFQTMEESFVCIYVLTNMHDNVTSMRRLMSIFPKLTKFSVFEASCLY